MKYRIGIVARLFGLTGETLRNYEKAGLIVSHRDEDSAYRYYDIGTITKLLGVRTLRNEGFSIDELQQIYHDISFEEYHALMREKIALRKKELAVSRAIYEQLQWTENCFSKIAAGDLPVPVMSPELYLLPYRDDQILNIEGVKTGRVAEWAQNLFLVQSYMRYSKTLQMQSGEDFNAALAVSGELARLLEIDTSPPVRCQAPMKCIRCLCERFDNDDPFAHIKPLLQSRFRELSVAPLEGAFSITVSSFHSRDEKHSYMCLYVPVEEAPEKT